jgi:hypothetical protein
MVQDNAYYGAAESAWQGRGSLSDTMIAKLTEQDRRAVDILLAGEPQGEELPAAVLDRVNAVRRFLTLLDAMPAHEASATLAEATLRKIAAAQVVTQQATNNPSATL